MEVFQNGHDGERGLEFSGIDKDVGKVNHNEGWPGNLLFFIRFRPGNILRKAVLAGWIIRVYPAKIYLCKVNNINTRKRNGNMLNVNNKNIGTKSRTSFWCFYLILWVFCTFLNCFCRYFEQVNVSWVFTGSKFVVLFLFKYEFAM